MLFFSQFPSRDTDARWKRTACIYFSTSASRTLFCAPRTTCHRPCSFFDDYAAAAIVSPAFARLSRRQVRPPPPRPPHGPPPRLPPHGHSRGPPAAAAVWATATTATTWPFERAAAAGATGGGGGGAPPAIVGRGRICYPVAPCFVAGHPSAYLFRARLHSCVAPGCIAVWRLGRGLPTGAPRLPGRLGGGVVALRSLSKAAASLPPHRRRRVRLHLPLRDLHPLHHPPAHTPLVLPRRLSSLAALARGASHSLPLTGSEQSRQTADTQALSLLRRDSICPLRTMHPHLHHWVAAQLGDPRGDDHTDHELAGRERVQRPP